MDPSAFDLAEKIFSSQIQQPSDQPEEITKELVTPMPQPISTRLPLTVCPECGFTIENYKAVERLGCAKCYEVFWEEIVPMLQQVQNSLQHCGKQPKHALHVVRMEKDMENLQLQLEKAVKREDYEKAAQIRDEIGKIKFEG